MDYIYKSQSLTIRNINELYIINSSYNNYIHHCLHSLNIKPEKNAISSEIKIQLDSIISLQDYLDNKPDKLLDVDNVNFIIQDVVNQIQYLEGNNKTVSYFSIRDFLILNNTSCLFIGLDKLYDFNKQGKYNLQDIIKNKSDGFMSPELLSVTKIPSSIHYKSCYYSFGLLLLKIFIDVDLTNIKDYAEKSKSIHGLPCYWFIQNTLEKITSDRHILFI
jgi:hypothetical protein